MSERDRLIDPDITFDTVGLSNAICRHPPLKPKPGGLSDFEFTIFANLISLAWSAHSGDGRQIALAAGKKAMKAERSMIIANRGKEGRPTIESVGSKAYHAVELPPVPAKIELVPISARGLLRKAQFKAGKNVARLFDALDRLCDPICGDGPLLTSCRTLKSGKLGITIDSGLWVPTGNFKQVILPFPTDTHRTRALPLYLLMHLLDFERASKQSMNFEAVCDAFGITASDNRRRVLRRAVDAVNKHLDKRVPNGAKHTVHYLPQITVRFYGDRVQFIDVNADERAVDKRSPQRSTAMFGLKREGKEANGQEERPARGRGFTISSRPSGLDD